MGKKRAASGKRAPLELPPTSTEFLLKLTQYQRDSLLLYTRLESAIKKRVEAAGTGTQVITCTKHELDHMHDEVGQAVVYARSPHKQRLVAIQKKVDDILEALQLVEFGIERPTQRQRPERESDMLMQLKIILLEVRPTVWRRILIEDCTLGELHEHVQLAMGWQDDHMHRFTIEGERYSMPMPDDFDMEFIDETQVMLSDILPQSGKRFRFRYEYDFGDGWQHEILFEGNPPIENDCRLPQCLEGERACPPEDIGGPWGYAEYVEALADSSHDRHGDYMEWSGPFDAEDFSAEMATKTMRKGFPRL